MATLMGGPFVGRQREMDELKSALEEAVSGHGRLVMLVGEPGIGKTRTAQELANQAQELGVQVWWGRCYEEQGTPPYWPWVQAMRLYVRGQAPERLLAEMGTGASNIAEILPEVKEKFPGLPLPLGLDRPEYARFRLFDSITTYLKAVSRTQPLVLALDDLHWADKPSLLLLQFLATEIASSPLMLLGTYRDVELSRQHPLSETLAQLSREPVFRRIVLRGLNQDDTHHFVEVTAGISPTSRLAQAIHSHTEGNPFFMGEVVRLIQERGELSDKYSGLPQGMRIPEGIREVIGQRLNRLSQQCNEALAVASVIGREFSFNELRLLVNDLIEDRLLEVLEEALAGRVIEEFPQVVGGYQFTHPLIQETLLEELSLTRRVRLHARIAEALEKLYENQAEVHAAELAHHFGQAEAVLGSEKVMKYSLLAGEKALAAYGWEEALQHFQRGLTAKGIHPEAKETPPDAETAALLFGLGRAQVATRDLFHHPEVVVDTLTRAFDYYEASGDVAQAVVVAEFRLVATPVQAAGASRLIDRALALVPPDSHVAGRLLSRRIRMLGVDENNYPAAQEAAQRALAIARREQDGALELWTLAFSASVETHYAHYQEAASQCEQALALARRLDDPQSELVARDYWHISRQVLGEGPSEAAHQNGTAMLRQAERLHDHFSLGDALWVGETIAYQEWDWQEARQYHDRALAVLPGDPRGLALRVALEYQAGEIGPAEVYLERLLELMRRAPPEQKMPRSFSPLGVAVAGYLSGDTSRLAEAEAMAQSVLSSPQTTHHHAMALWAALGLIAVQRGDLEQCQEQYQALEPHRGITVIGSTLTLTDRVLGLLSHTLGNLDTASEHFEDALAYLHKSGNRPELVWTCCEYADTLLQRNNPGDHRKAEALLDEALTISQDLSIQPLMGRVVALQEQASSQPARSPAYPDDLTVREVEVLRLIATGKSDREISEALVIAGSTVRRHVNNIYAKIGVNNRAEATRYALGEGLLPIDRLPGS